MPDFFEELIRNTCKIGAVYKIKAPKLIETNVPHYFVVIAIDEEETNYLLLSTTQLRNKIDYFKNKGYDLNTLAHITPAIDNGFTQSSYFNCNEYFLIEKGQLVKKLEQQQLSYEGRINEIEYGDLLKAIQLSKVNDIPPFLLKYIP